MRHRCRSGCRSHDNCRCCPSSRRYQSLRTGPNPTAASIEAATGRFSVGQQNVSRLAARGFGGITWLKRFADDDRRYSQFLCPAAQAGGVVNEYHANYPY
ncbi:poly(ethylene terephthalate) hydrolase family protein [Rhodococcus opacus]|uniref:poly(ethylene terephthalate) hydrolase family protein n=1 Tax=Rhodococcus opacus TaxID=37919 RepID=UPI00403600FF